MSDFEPIPDRIRIGVTVILCGLGRVGTQLALEFRRNGEQVVAIEADGSPGQTATAPNARVAVIAGDARNPGTLRRAAVSRASRISAVCDDDQNNAAIAMASGKIRLARTGVRYESESGCLPSWGDARLSLRKAVN